MSNVIGARAPGWFRVVGLLGLLWNSVGIYNYLIAVGMFGHSPAMVSGPAWVTAAFAISTFGGALGSLGLLLLKNWGRWLLILSFLAILAQDLFLFVLRPEAPKSTPLAIIVTVVGVLLAWFAQSAVKRNWLS